MKTSLIQAVKTEPCQEVQDRSLKIVSLLLVMVCLRIAAHISMPIKKGKKTTEKKAGPQKHTAHGLSLTPSATQTDLKSVGEAHKGRHRAVLFYSSAPGVLTAPAQSFHICHATHGKLEMKTLAQEAIVKVVGGKKQASLLSSSQSSKYHLFLHPRLGYISTH